MQIHTLDELLVGIDIAALADSSDRARRENR